jgi:hypothetical protein
MLSVVECLQQELLLVGTLLLRGNVMSSTEITTDVPINVAITASPVWRTFHVNNNMTRLAEDVAVDVE